MEESNFCRIPCLQHTTSNKPKFSKVCSQIMNICKTSCIALIEQLTKSIICIRNISQTRMTTSISSEAQSLSQKGVKKITKNLECRNRSSTPINWQILMKLGKNMKNVNIFNPKKFSFIGAEKITFPPFCL